MMTEASGTEDDGLYLPELYKAVVKGDWESATTFFHCHSADMDNPRISKQLKTALHLAVGTGRSNHFVQKTLDCMQPSDLALQDDNGETALTIAATVGNLEAAKLLVNKNPDLPIPSRRKCTASAPSITAADGIQPSPYDGESGVTILILLVLVGFYDGCLMRNYLADVALDLLKKNPGMGSQVFCRRNSSEYFGCVPPRFDKFTENRNRADTENPAESTEVEAQTSSYLRNCTSYVFNHLGDESQLFIQTKFMLKYLKFVVKHYSALELEILVYMAEAPCVILGRSRKIRNGTPNLPVKNIRETKVMHDQVLEIVRLLCTYAAGLDVSQAAALLRNPLLLAGEFGIPKIIEEIAEQLPHKVRKFDRQEHGIFQRAVISSRHLAPPHQLNLFSGAALQMQRKLQWYKCQNYHFQAVENFLPPAFREMKNHEGKKPAVFTEAHKDLVIEGEKWMKDTANSCTVVVALIATVVFAAAITVPGGNADSGYRIFFREKAFIIFAVSDAPSLFSSTAAILMFLSILTARHAEDDFLYALPERLILGLLTLFISITSMMIAFSSTLYLVFGQVKTWILTSVAGSTCLLVVLFVYLQFPLLLVMINSTYGAGIFAKQSKRPLC
ncbi:uncharacterized protein LOC111300879 [Durio zibethinus]|uniref:Uncharacterized protein LOC111300879 n=1 Tax=Durio zibethinus TaxID=66656 RepID=A0A6P5ZHJ3_DURZI|nr:uncharacterized protein LOC111300879 [Durio zibethinus]